MFINSGDFERIKSLYHDFIDESMDNLHDELSRQFVKFPRFPADDLTALRVIVEEVGEVARALDTLDDENLKEEILQIAAVCIRWYARIIDDSE